MAAVLGPRGQLPGAKTLIEVKAYHADARFDRLHLVQIALGFSCVIAYSEPVSLLPYWFTACIVRGHIPDSIRSHCVG